MSPPSSANDRPPRDPAPPEREALAWVARLDRGLNAAEEAAFERWLAAHPRHAALLREFDGTWTLLDRVRELPAGGFASAAPAPELVMPMEPRRTTLPRRGVATLAAAAAVVLGVLGWNAQPSRTPAGTPYTAVAGTQIGELRTLHLPDGSLIRLNTASTVEVGYSTAARAIHLLSGEAHFTVMKDAARPFTVTAGTVTVRAVGTAFNVRVRADAVDVLVTAGHVRLRDETPSLPAAAEPAGALAPGSPPLPAPFGTGNPPDYTERALAAGEAISLPRPGHAAAAGATPRSVSMSPVEIERTLAWQERRLEFVAEPLAAMVAEFNRYNRVKLVIADPALAAERFGGNFRADDPAGFVRVLEANFRVVAEYRPEATVLRPAP